MYPRRVPFVRPAVDPTVAAENLRTALARVGDALSGVDVEALLVAETELSLAVAAAAVVSRSADREATRQAVQLARAELLRCRRLGSAFSALSRRLTGVGQPVESYTRSGSYADSVRRRASLILARA